MRLVRFTLLFVLLGSVPALAKAPSYHSPHYKGTRKTPKTKAPPVPKPIPLTQSGRFPNLVVDAAGTAHIAWVEDGKTDADPDTIVYCRIKRGESGCDTTQRLLWNKSYDPGDFPRANVDNGGPRVTVVGDQVTILSHRYPTVYVKPDDSNASATTLLWVSEDGGNTFTGPGIVGGPDMNGGTPVAFGTPDHPLIGVIDDTVTGGTNFEALSPGAFTSAKAFLGNVAQDAAYYGTLALDAAGNPVAAFSNLDNQIFTRKWTGAGDPNDVNTWSPATVLAGDEPVLTSGPRGIYLMSRPKYGEPLTLRHLGDNLVAAAPYPISGKSVGHFHQVFEDPGGGVQAEWSGDSTGNNSSPDSLKLRTSFDGATFGPARTIFTGKAIGQNRLAAAADGGGFSVANLTGGVNSAGVLAAVGFGSAKLTGKLGLGSLTGGSGDPNATSSCTTLGFGDIDITSPAGCFLHGTGQYAKDSVSTGEVDLNGLKLIPDAGVSISINPRDHTLDTSGSVRVLLVGGGTSITLWHGELHLKLPTGDVGTTLFSFDTSQFGVDLLGFGVAGKVDVILTKTGVRIPISLKLPPVFGDIHGEATLLADSATGLHLDSLHIHIGNVFIGPLLVDHIDITYSGGTDTWTGDGKVVMPAGGALAIMDVRFEKGAYKHGGFTFTFPPPGVVIGPAVYLTQIGGSLGLDPTVIQATARIGAGTPGIGGVSPVNVDGAFTMTFPSSGPADFKMNGAVSFFMFTVGHGFFDFQTDGYAGFGGDVGGDFGPLHVEGKTDGFIDASGGKFGASIGGSTCIDVVLSCVGLDADLAVSNAGFAACAQALGGSIGVEFPTGDFNPIYLINPAALALAVLTHIAVPCNTGDYYAPPRPVRRQAGGGQAVSVPGGHPTVTLAIAGSGGAPKVTVAGPGGATSAYAMSPAGGSTTYVVLNKPAAGTWTVTPAAGSAAITDIKLSNGYTAATVSARLHKHTIRYAIKSAGNGQSVAFEETGAFGTHLLGAAKGAKGTLKFTPANARGGKRTVTALIEHDGLIKSRKVIGTYTAPGPRKPGRVGHLKAKLRKGRLTVTWKRSRGAKRYLVRIKGSHGTALLRVVKTTHVTVALRPGEKAKVTVAGQDAAGRKGPSRSSRA